MKEELLRNVEAARAKELEVLAPHVDDSEPAEPGTWTVKDTVAHLAAWREYAVAEIEAGLAGGESPELESDEETQNAKLYAEMRGLSAKDVLHRAARSWAALADGIQGCSEQQLVGPRPGRPGMQLWHAVRGNGYAHLGEHLGYWYEANGDLRGAEDAAIWARDLSGAIPNDSERGNGEYDLACFYAKRGRAAEALGHLERAVSLNPELRDWAAKDADLDPIRSQPEVARLLAG